MNISGKFHQNRSTKQTDITLLKSHDEPNDQRAENTARKHHSESTVPSLTSGSVRKNPHFPGIERVLMKTDDSQHKS